MTQIHKIMAANRGEIAIRIFRAASEIDIRTVAIYTFEDRYSLHRYKADEAYQIGPDDEPLKPYLDIEEIIRVAKDNEVDAIHPGYGFLSENEQFAIACRQAGIIWVGPSPDSMKGLGDKLSAKAIAKKAGVPVIDASDHPIVDIQELKETSVSIGYPVILKAAYGGGGRGMRVVRTEEDLLPAFKEASREAKTAFGNPDVFVEKYIDDPKHLEVQLLGDQHGNLVHLFERDCSVQRRFQKVVEVAPAISVSDSAKQKLYKYALAIGNMVGYENAGTVEFLIDKDENIYFIEVNTRIQVEHTITEVITGIDIVRSQILIASGKPLHSDEIAIKSQEDIQFRGVAIQCRITTEDPAMGFKPDYGRLVAYRSASGFGIRLDAGNAYAGSTISPFFDSMLVKVTSWGMKLTDSANRLHRALREFRIRGVKSNIPFLLNILRDETFRSGNTTVHYISRHPELMEPPKWKDRGTKMIRYIGEVIVNGNPDVQGQKIPDNLSVKHLVPNHSGIENPKPGTKQRLDELGPEKFSKWLLRTPSIQFTDTTMRDAHQSLLATRMRTYDLLNVAESYSKHFGHHLFSMEVWGGATFDVCMRFLKECPWERLAALRKAIPNTLMQMLLRGSNAVGYKAYPDNLIEEFIEQSWKTGIDVFRIFDSLNWVEAMKTSIHAVRERTAALAEVCICYTGDALKTEDNKYDIRYYVDLAREIEDQGAHILAIKDMAGLLKPGAAKNLISELKSVIDIPVHLHTHDTSSVQAATYLKAIDAGVDVIDVAISSLSGLTSQPNFNSVLAMLDTHPRNNPMDLDQLNQFSLYWEGIRRMYAPFETELKSGTAEVYYHEIPGGQYSNLRPQARALGLENQFETIKKNYRAVNELLGGIVKVTPSSKVVGDMAMFMTANNLTADDIRKRGDTLSFPDSMISLMKGELGQRKEGWPEKLQKDVLKNETAFKDRPNEHLAPIDFEAEMLKFRKEYPESNKDQDLLSALLYPKVFGEFYEHLQHFADTSKLPTWAFFYGLQPHDEIVVTIARGKNILIEYLNANEADENGNRLVIFRLNGSIRSVVVNDQKVSATVVKNTKAVRDDEIGSPLQGSLSQILVKEGDSVGPNTPLFTIEAMKMESTIVSPSEAKIKKIILKPKTLVEQDDLVMTLEYT